MKNTLQNAIKTSAFAIAFAFAGASHATETYSLDAIGGYSLTFADAKLFKDTTSKYKSQGAGMYQMTSDDDFSKQFYAYCIAPSIDALGTAVYSAHAGAQVDNAIKALFETSFKSTIGDDSKQYSFQLALWELNNDDGNLYAKTGAQYFAYGTDEVEAAQEMLNSIQGYQLKNLYRYTTFTGVTAAGVQSQDMLGVSPVPEVESWAMMAMGLGLVGVMSRRRRQDDEVSEEKFA